jgi:hypothetical protein
MLSCILPTCAATHSAYYAPTEAGGCRFSPRMASRHRRDLGFPALSHSDSASFFLTYPFISYSRSQGLAGAFLYDPPVTVSGEPWDEPLARAVAAIDTTAAWPAHRHYRIDRGEIWWGERAPAARVAALRAAPTAAPPRCARPRPPRRGSLRRHLPNPRTRCRCNTRPTPRSASGLDQLLAAPFPVRTVHCFIEQLHLYTGNPPYSNLAYLQGWYRH